MTDTKPAKMIYRCPDCGLWHVGAHFMEARLATGRFYTCPFCGGVPAYMCLDTPENRTKYSEVLKEGEKYSSVRVIVDGYEGVSGIYTSIEEEGKRFVVERSTCNDGARTTLERRAFDKCKAKLVNNNLIVPAGMRGRPLRLPRYRMEE